MDKTLEARLRLEQVVDIDEVGGVGGAGSKGQSGIIKGGERGIYL